MDPWVGKIDPLEKVKATHSSILAWRISWGHKELDTTERLSLYLFCWVIVRSRNYICQKPGTRTRTASAARVMALSEPFLEPLVAGNQKAPLASLSP